MTNQTFAAQVTAALASELVKRLIDAGSTLFKRTFAAPARATALEKATALALDTALSSFDLDQVEFDHFQTIFTDFLYRPRVIAELTQVVDAQPGAEINHAILEEEFRAAGYEPGEFGAFEFNIFITVFLRAFYNHAAADPQLSTSIEIGLLRILVDNFQVSVIVSLQTASNTSRTAISAQEAVTLLKQILDRLAAPTTPTAWLPTFVKHKFLTTLPQSAEHFTGRKREIRKLLTLVQPGRVVTLVGPGGIGKTALVLEVLHKLPEDQFPDGIFFHTFYNQPQSALCLEQICRAFGQEPKPNPSQAASLLLANRKPVLVLDGAEQADDLRAILDVCGECAVLITSRRRSDAPNFQYFLEVKPLQHTESLALLRKWGGDCAADEQAGQAIIQLIGGLPLAIRLVGRYLRQQNQLASEYLQWLQSTPLEALDQGKRHLENVPLLLERSLQVLPENTGLLLALMGVLAFAPFPKALFQPALILPPAKEQHVLTDLVNYGLVIRRKAQVPLFELAHPLVHAYARLRLSASPDALTRLAAYFIELMETETPQGPQGFKHLDVYRPHILALQQALLTHENWSTVIDLAGVGDDYLDLSGHWIERLGALQAGLQAAEEIKDRRLQSQFLDNLGMTYASLGQVEEAIADFQQALLIAREIGDRRGEGTDLGNLGLAYYSLGQVDKAILHYQQALLIAREIGDRRNEGVWLGNLGVAYYSLGQVDKAILHYQQALLIAREIDYRRSEGAHLGNLGMAYYSLGQVEKAIAHYQQALLIAREIGDRRNEGACLSNLGVAYYSLRQVEKAIQHYQQALLIAREIGDRRNEGTHLGHLGRVYAYLGQVDSAIDYDQQALIIAREIGDPSLECGLLCNIGEAYSYKGQSDQSIQYYQQVLMISRELGYRPIEGYVLAQLGLDNAILGRMDDAINYLKQAILFFGEYGAQFQEILCSSNLALVYEHRGDFTHAASLAVNALPFLIEAKLPEEIGKIKNLIARLRENMGDTAFNAALSLPPDP